MTKTNSAMVSSRAQRGIPRWDYEYLRETLRDPSALRFVGMTRTREALNIKR